MNEKNILLACMPKSGSTFMTRILSNLPGFGSTSWVPDYGRREQELCLDSLRSELSCKRDVRLVAQLHVRYSKFTADCMQKFDLAPLVLVRNIFDIVPSLIDHHRNTSVVYPMAFTPSSIIYWEWERAANFVVDMVLPWYFNFYVSWFECESKCLITYDKLQSAPEKFIGEICAQLGILVSEKDIENAVKKASSLNTRLNVGVIGRGQMLPESCVEKIYKMMGYYAGVDFSPILPSAENNFNK